MSSRNDDWTVLGTLDEYDPGPIHAREDERLRAEVKRLRELCLYLADWAGYWRSGRADPRVLRELRIIRGR